ncbi:MAG: NAD-dependent epimerase/dehydratase family protein [Candidatus Omnitrophica bacterium]|nr:NAD-dependent epimerase/dehydratase family protein [Candidatus Omnitrophota bacterium]MDD5501636.1 NAD-dependent epimerase/dehydratase family protein [Candidatus Omnitrophota bacterium]
MATVIVTGSCGLIGSETVSFFADKGFDIVGIDNNMRRNFFGPDGSVLWNRKRLQKLHKNYRHYSVDIRDSGKINSLFKKYSKDIALIVHAAAQPSHDWAARDPEVDFGVNAQGTLVMLEAARKFSPWAVFIFTSTNKVYGDTPNRLPLVEKEKRFEIADSHQYSKGIDESMSIDNCLHSVFGASKVAADIMVQEYGKYFHLRTGVFRGGCLTGPAHSGAELHGFLSYLVKCCVTGRKYKIYGYKGKQVRDNIHSYDLVNAFYHYFQNPRCGEVYNMGGGRFANVSILEAIELCEKLSGSRLSYDYVDTNRIGDHIWWVSDVSKFKSHYPSWQYAFNIESTLSQIIDSVRNSIKY